VNPDQRPRVPPQRLAWTALAGCLGATLAGLTIVRLSPAVGLWFNEVFCILGVAWAVTRWSGRAPAAYVRLTWPGLPSVLFASGLAVANFFGLALPIRAASEHFAPDALKDFDLTHVLDQFSTADTVLFATAAVLGAAFCEEFLFRGVVQQGLLAGGAHPAESILRGGLVFALFHLDPVGLLALFELGLLFGLLYHRTGSLLPGMVAHATQNATALALYFVGRRTQLPEGTEDVGARQLLALAGMGLTVLGMLFLLGRHFPQVWGRPRSQDFERPRVPLARAFAPWLVGASLFILGWFLADRRGLELGVVDVQVSLPSPRTDEPTEVHAARTEMEALRKRVRIGQAPLENYVESRRALAESLKEPHPAPPPK
jgi:uncharacterized protein